MALSVSLACSYRETGKTESPKFTHVPQRRSNPLSVLAVCTRPSRSLWDVSFFSFVALVDVDDFILKWPQTQQ